MSLYVTDAHALLWYLYSPEKLGRQALATFDSIESGDHLIIPLIVVAEMIMVAEKGRIPSTVESMKSIIRALQREPNCYIATLTAEDIVESAALVSIPDIFDRLIVYEAVKHNAPLITRDETIVGSGLVDTIW